MTFQPPPFLRGIEKSMIRKISDRAKPGSISLGLGEPDLPTPEVIRREAIRVIQEEKSGYTLQAGIPALREKIASDYPHMNLNIDEVIVTAGSQESLYLILRTLVEEGDEVLTPDPGFIAYPMIIKMLGGREVRYRLPAAGDFAFDINDFKSKISARTKVVICISPSNPTGRRRVAQTHSSLAMKFIASFTTQRNGRHRSQNSIRAQSSSVAFRNRCA